MKHNENLIIRHPGQDVKIDPMGAFILPIVFADYLIK